MLRRIDRVRVQELLRIAPESGRLRLYPFGLAIGNLAFCASFERLVTEYARGHYLFLFYLVELGALALVSAGSFYAREREIVAKTRVFPVTPAERFLAVVLGLARRRSVAALVATACLFAAVLYGSRPALAAAAIGLYAVAAALTVAVTALVCLATQQSSRAALALTVACAGAAVCVVCVSMVLGPTRLAPYVPVSSWLARAVLSAGAGAVGASLAWAGALCAALLTALAAGVRGR